MGIFVQAGAGDKGCVRRGEAGRAVFDHIEGFYYGARALPASGADLVRLGEIRRQHEGRIAGKPLAGGGESPRHQAGTDLTWKRE
jgi:hypothetical protein